MRRHFSTAIGAFVLGTALTLAFASQRPGPATIASLDREGRAGAEARARALEERIAELEAALGEVKARGSHHRLAESRLVSAPKAATTAASPDGEEDSTEDASTGEHLPTLDELFAFVDARDAAGLRTASRKLLRAGAPQGFETLTAFLGAESRSPRQALLAHGPLVAALAGLALEDSAATAKLASWILARTGDVEPALLARLRSLLPAFLGGRGDRFPALRSEFVAYLDDTFRAEGDARLEALDALSELGEPAPADELRDLLLETDDQNLYKKLLAHVIAVEHETGIETLIEFLDTVEDVNHWAVPFALRTLAEVESPLAREYVFAWQQAEDAKLRDLAELALDSSSLESVVEVLDSSAGIDHKRAVLRELASREPALLEELRLDAEVFPPDVREAIENGGAVPTEVADVPTSWELDRVVLRTRSYSPVETRVSTGNQGDLPVESAGVPLVKFWVSREDAIGAVKGEIDVELTSQRDLYSTYTNMALGALASSGAATIGDAELLGDGVTGAAPAPALPADANHSNPTGETCASCHAPNR